MKTRTLKVATLLLAASLTMTSCIGSFNLFNGLASWNKDATGNKFLNEIIFLVISPAYAICLFADSVVLNTVEFWTGSNPLASNIGKTKMVEGEDGLMYAVKTLKNGYEITKPNGDVVYLNYDKKTKTWSQSADGIEVKLFSFNDNGTIKAYLPTGAYDLTLDEAGVQKAQELVGISYAMR